MDEKQDQSADTKHPSEISHKGHFVLYPQKKWQDHRMPTTPSEMTLVTPSESFIHMARSYLVWQGILCFYWSMVQEILGFYWSTAWQGESPWSPPCGCCVASSRTGRHAVLKRWEVWCSKLGNSCVTWRKLLKKSVWFYFVSNYNHMCKVIQQCYDHMKCCFQTVGFFLITFG